MRRPLKKSGVFLINFQAPGKRRNNSFSALTAKRTDSIRKWVSIFSICLKTFSVFQLKNIKHFRAGFLYITEPVYENIPSSSFIRCTRTLIRLKKDWQTWHEQWRALLSTMIPSLSTFSRENPKFWRFFLFSSHLCRLQAHKTSSSIGNPRRSGSSFFMRRKSPFPAQVQRFSPSTCDPYLPKVWSVFSVEHQSYQTVRGSSTTSSFSDSAKLDISCTSRVFFQI